MSTLAVFDMAGTTIDDGGAVYRALEQAVAETGVAVAPEDLQTWMGAEKRAAITALIELGGGDPRSPEGKVDAAFERFLAILDELYTQAPPTPIGGAEQAFADLRAAGLQIALTTGFSRDVADGILAGLGWVVSGTEAAALAPDGAVVLDAVVCGDEVAQGRPAPYMIHRAMELTGTLDVADLVIAGDTVVDVQAGANAGAGVTIGVLTGKLDRDAFAGQPYTALLDSVAAIPAFLAARA
ncbi:phosphonatase-like hydrolase [Leucobacter zeae]|nr:phosphonatase-like hydrolase [Leucobacter zeae]